MPQIEEKTPEGVNYNYVYDPFGGFLYGYLLLKASSEGHINYIRDRLKGLRDLGSHSILHFYHFMYMFKLINKIEITQILAI